MSRWAVRYRIRLKEVSNFRHNASYLSDLIVQLKLNNKIFHLWVNDHKRSLLTSYLWDLLQKLRPKLVGCVPPLCYIILSMLIKASLSRKKSNISCQESLRWKPTPWSDQHDSASELGCIDNIMFLFLCTWTHLWRQMGNRGASFNTEMSFWS